MMELNHSVSLSDYSIQELRRHKKQRSSCQFSPQVWRLGTENTSRHACSPQTEFFIHSAFHSSLQEAQTGVKWPTSRQQTCTAAFSKQLTASSGRPLSSLWRSATAITSTSQDLNETSSEPQRTPSTGSPSVAHQYSREVLHLFLMMWFSTDTCRATSLMVVRKEVRKFLFRVKTPSRLWGQTLWTWAWLDAVHFSQIWSDTMSARKFKWVEMNQNNTFTNWLSDGEENINRLQTACSVSSTSAEGQKSQTDLSKNLHCCSDNSVRVNLVWRR